MGRRNPQEKKALSYAKDRRNDYGENDKGSRKNIRRNKRTPNRAGRHRERQVLAAATGPVTAEAAEQLRRRADLGMDDPVDIEARIDRIRRRTN